MSRFMIGLLLSASLVGVSTTAAPVPDHLMPKEPPLYFPTRVGAKWVYSTGVKGVFGEIKVTRSVTAVEQTPAGLVVTVTNHQPGGKSFLDSKLLVTPAGITQIESIFGKLESPCCWLKLPCVSKESWESDCSNELSVQTWKCTTIGAEEVKVPAGRFTTIRVHTTLASEPRGLQQLPSLNISDVTWYAPGVGAIKIERSGVAPTWELETFTL